MLSSDCRYRPVSSSASSTSVAAAAAAASTISSSAPASSVTCSATVGSSAIPRSSAVCASECSYCVGSMRGMSGSGEPAASVPVMMPSCRSNPAITSPYIPSSINIELTPRVCATLATL